MITLVGEVPQRDALLSSVFVYPTETCYGLGCNALDQKLVQKIYAIKGRASQKPFSWIVADISMAQEYVVFSKIGRALAEKYWPGPLTLVLPSRNVADQYIGLRVSSHRVAQKIVCRIGQPLISTSANQSGERQCYQISALQSVFMGRLQKPDFIINGGDLPENQPTTIVKVIGEDVEILRQGAIVVD